MTLVGKLGAALVIAAGSIAWPKANLSGARNSQKHVGQQGFGESFQLRRRWGGLCGGGATAPSPPFVRAASTSSTLTHGRAVKTRGLAL